MNSTEQCPSNIFFSATSHNCHYCGISNISPATDLRTRTYLVGNLLFGHVCCLIHSTQEWLAGGLDIPEPSWEKDAPWSHPHLLDKNPPKDPASLRSDWRRHHFIAEGQIKRYRLLWILKKDSPRLKGTISKGRTLGTQKKHWKCLSIKKPSKILSWSHHSEQELKYSSHNN